MTGHRSKFNRKKVEAIVALLAVRNLEEATAQLSWRKASEIEADWESPDDRLGLRDLPH